LWSPASVCVSVCLSAAACLHCCTDPELNWGSGMGCPLVVHYWADLQSVNGLRCCGNVTRTRSVSEYTLVLALCLVYSLSARIMIGYRCSGVSLGLYKAIVYTHHDFAPPVLPPGESLSVYALLAPALHRRLWANMTSSTKPEVHTILHCHQ